MPQSAYKKLAFLSVYIGLLTIPVSMVNAQNCRDSIIASTTGHFIDNNDGTISDTYTGLIWKKCSEGQTWASATNSCEGTATSLNWQSAFALSDNNWRLPNIKELGSIVENRCINPAVDELYFPDTPFGGFWSSTPYANDNGLSWAVYFGSGQDSLVSRVSDFEKHVRLVRNEN